MFVHSKDYVTNVDKESIQPNAVDIRASAFTMIVGGSITISEKGKQFFPRATARTEYHGYTDEHYTPLLAHSSYEFDTNHEVTIPEGMVGWLVIRSTFARNGLLIGNGLYDSGYSGPIGGVVHNLTPGIVKVSPNIRIAQFVMAKAESAHLYNGFYQGIATPAGE